MIRRSVFSLPSVLAFLSGFIDTAAFVHMGGLFVAHVTGNFVLLGATLAGAQVSGHGGSTTLQLIAFPVFFVGAVIAGVLAGRIEPTRRTGRLLWLSAAMIGAAALVSWLDDIPEVAAVSAMTLVLAMGVLNAAHRLDGTLGPPFTVMTGNVTALAIATANRLTLRLKADEQQPGTSVAPTAWLVLAFALGCGAGALAQNCLGFGAMIIPAILLAMRLAIR